MQGRVVILKFRAKTPSPSPMSGGHSTIIARIAEDADGWRLDRALAAAVPTLSRERLKALISSGAVAGPAGLVRDPAVKAVPGGSYEVTIPEPRPAHNEAQDIALEIVFEDEYLLVVDKPAGMVVHPAAGNFDGTLVNALLHHCAGRLSGIGGVARPGIVHRIDKDTSGLLVVAKTDVAHEGLAAQFARHSIDRRYLAIVAGVPVPAAGTIDAPLARSSANRKKIAIVKDGRGKRAVTRYRIIAAAQRGGVGGMPARNRPHPPGAGPHGLDRPSLARRPGLWRVAGGASRDIEKAGFSPSGPARGRVWLRASGLKSELILQKRPSLGYSGTVRGASCITIVCRPRVESPKQAPRE